MGEGRRKHLWEEPLPSLICLSPSERRLRFPHLQKGLIVWGLQAHCVGKGASLAGHQFVTICSLALIGWTRRRLPRAWGHRSL